MNVCPLVIFLIIINNTFPIFQYMDQQPVTLNLMVVNTTYSLWDTNTNTHQQE